MCIITRPTSRKPSNHLRADTEAGTDPVLSPQPEVQTVGVLDHGQGRWGERLGIQKTKRVMIDKGAAGTCVPWWAGQEVLFLHAWQEDCHLWAQEVPQAPVDQEGQAGQALRLWTVDAYWKPPQSIRVRMIGRRGERNIQHSEMPYIQHKASGGHPQPVRAHKALQGLR